MLLLAKAALSNWWQGPLLVAVLFQVPLLQWLSLALMALITLRQGFQFGAVSVVALCLLTAAVGQFVGFKLGLPTVGLIACVATLGAAQVLRMLRLPGLSWFVASALIAAAYFACEGFYPQALSQYKLTADSMIELWLSGVPVEQRQQVINNAQALTVQVIVTLPLMLTTVAILLARFWQAKLFNPGGFGEEFQSTRVDKPLALLCITLWLVFQVTGSALLYGLANVFMLPFLMAGVGFFHWLGRFRQLSLGWYVAFYLFFIFLQFGVVLLAVLDSFFNLRERLIRKAQRG